MDKRSREFAKSMRRLVRSWKATAKSVEGMLSSIDWTTTQRDLERYKKAMKLNEGNRIRKAWSAVGRLTLKDVAEIVDYLPKPPGRPLGSSRVITDELISSLSVRVANGEKPTPVAKKLLEERGMKATKGQADHLVRKWRKRD